MLIFVAVMFGLLSGLHAAEASQRGPNIIVLLCDDLGCGDVQCLNPERGKIPTPHLDALAKSGMVFTDAHSASSVCTPTRYGIMTGRYPWRTTRRKGVVQGFAPNLIAADRPTLGDASANDIQKIALWKSPAASLD